MASLPTSDAAFDFPGDTAVTFFLMSLPELSWGRLVPRTWRGLAEIGWSVPKFRMSPGESLQGILLADRECQRISVNSRYGASAHADPLSQTCFP